MIYTQTMQSIDTMSIPQEGVGASPKKNLVKDVQQVQNLSQAKFSLKEILFSDKVFMNFKTAKITKFQYK